MSNSTIEVGQRFSDARCMKVVIINVGNMPTSKFREYEALIKAFNVFDLDEIKAEILDNKLTHFPAQDRKGKIYLNYVDSKSSERSDIEELQIHRKVLGVIGVVHCPTYKDLSSAKKDFASLSNQYTSSIAKICLAFSPLNDQDDLERGIVIMIPSVGKIGFYLSRLLLDFTKTLLQNLETYFESIDKVFHFIFNFKKNIII